MSDVAWMRIPSDLVLADRKNWHAAESGVYWAARAHLLVMKHRGATTKNGPTLKFIKLPANVKYSIEHKKLKVTKQTETIEDSIQITVGSKLATELGNRISSKVGLDKTLLPTVALSAEASAKFVSELTESFRHTLSTKKAYGVEYSEEITRSITLESSSGNNPGTPLVLYFYTALWPWNWDVYLHRIESNT